MTDYGKRERLVGAARTVIHRQGVEKTTLADIAEAADVPVGNVYYYFKTKDDLVEAAITEQLSEIESMLGSLDALRTPQARLKAFIRELGSHSELVAKDGCPLGSLCSELDKRHDRIDRSGARLLEVPLAWLEQQFRAIGRRDAKELAVATMSSYLGAALVTNTFRDPKMLESETRRLTRWIDSLA
jgi:AcrR family transcriptional regulator